MGGDSCRRNTIVDSKSDELVLQILSNRIQSRNLIHDSPKELDFDVGDTCVFSVGSLGAEDDRRRIPWVSCLGISDPWHSIVADGLHVSSLRLQGRRNDT
ncbi:hypothetical protein TNIN_294601 [Trichonephila inaurata madagascariensis]|uniref:Uncharacterized protein n=1 Tax=Trichonephila inaurata madagascariensis TaxID=2747483 RepID=A0A8X6IFX1_9ARAC|nr:hypothetical protein TNIN_294601 [Trichonephila inaurata madagascariensis]